MNLKQMMIGVGMVIMTLCSHPDAFAEKRVLTMAVSPLPPYNIAEDNSGMEYEIVKEALQNKGYEIQPKYVPLSRVKAEIADKTVDGAFPIMKESGARAFYSVPHMIYENVAVSLQKNHFGMKSIQALRDRSVVAFQDATRYLGKDFGAMAGTNPRYREITHQELQINLLYSGHCEIIVMDKNIFHYYRHRNQQVDIRQPVTIDRLFIPSPYSVAFLEEKTCDDFNDALKQLRESGRYHEIIVKYIGK